MTPQVELGVDAGARLATRLAGGSAVLVVDAGVAHGYAASVRHAMAGACDVHVAVVPPGEPTTASVDHVAAEVRRHPGATVVGIGGGSALDTAKQAAVAALGTQSIEHYALCANPFAGRRTIVAVPTTSGTGSEVTRTCIFTNAAGRKVWTWGDEMLPDVVLLDPRATVSLPPAVTACTGLDAVVHAIEAASGRRSTPQIVAWAAQAVRLADQHLHRAVAAGDDLDARQGMLEAAMLAGLAIDAGGTGMAHSIGHALGTLAKVPHGLAVAVGLQVALPWNVAGAAQAYDALATAVGVPAGGLPARFAELARSVGLGGVVGHFGALPATAEEIAAWMVADENMPMYSNNARAATENDRTLLAEQTVEYWVRAAESHR